MASPQGRPRRLTHGEELARARGRGCGKRGRTRPSNRGFFSCDDLTAGNKRWSHQKCGGIACLRFRPLSAAITLPSSRQLSLAQTPVRHPPPGGHACFHPAGKGDNERPWRQLPESAKASPYLLCPPRSPPRCGKTQASSTLQALGVHPGKPWGS